MEEAGESVCGPIEVSGYGYWFRCGKWPPDGIGRNHRVPDQQHSQSGEERVVIKFGVSFGDPPEEKSWKIVEAAEASGFHQAWAWDSHIIWNECYSLLGWLIGRMQQKTNRMEWGTLVTNPRTRDPIVTASAFATLNNITGGKAICGIGRGDSSVRVMSRTPVTLARLEEATRVIQTLGSGHSMSFNGVETRFATGNRVWASGGVPVYLGAYGPKALRLAGRIGNGVIFQIADPFFIEWGMRHVRAGAEEVGRDPREISVHCATASYITDNVQEARDELRWFPAVVGNHIADVLRNHGPEDIPQVLTDYVQGRKGYDYRDHAEQNTEHSEYVPDEIVDRFCVHGTPSQIVQKVKLLESLGVTEFNLYPHVSNFLSVIDSFGREIINKVNS